MEDDDIRDAGLGLGLGLGEWRRRENQKAEEKPPVVCLDLSFALRPFADAIDVDLKSDGSSLKVIDQEEYRNNKNCGRKKLRLTKEQSTLLEDSFKVHSTLNPFQKQTLAEQLNLKPRQVEVWFQNRRARTKLKQTEVDCEFLKKCCESLSGENQRLKKEVQELRLLKAASPSPLFIQLPKATLMCPSCKTLTKVSTDGKNTVAGNVVRNSSNKLQDGDFDGKS